MFLLDRSRTAGPLLEWKVRVFIVAGGLGLAGIYLEERWLTGTAIVLLFGGVLLRLSSRRDADTEGEEETDEVDPP